MIVPMGMIGPGGRWAVVRRSLIVLGLFVGVGQGCATTPKHADEKPLVLSIQDLTCSDCAEELEGRAKAVKGVYAAKFDPAKVELALEVAPGTTFEALRTAIELEPVDGKSVHVVEGGGQGRYAAFTTPEPSWDVKDLSVHGEDVPNLLATASAGKVTVFDFYAVWCGPCHALDEHLHRLLAADPKLATRRLNVVDWESPLAKHYLSDVSELPFAIVVDGRGHEIAKYSGLKLEELDGAIRAAKAGDASP